MFVSALRNHQNAGYFYLAILTVILRLVPAISPLGRSEVFILEPYIRSLFSLDFSFLSNSQLNIIFAGLTVYVQALIFNHILLRYNIFSKPSFIPAALYIIISSLVKVFLFLQPVLIVNFFMIWLVERIFAIYKTNQPIARAFDLGLIIAAGTFVYFPFITLLPVVWIGISTFLPFSWRVWLSGLLGFVVLYFFLGVFYFYADQLDRFFRIFQPFDLQFRARMEILLFDLLTLIPLAVTLLFAIRYYRQIYRKNLVQVRKSLQVLFSIVLFSGAGFYLQPFLIQYSGYGLYIKPRYTLLHFLIWAVPVSVYASYFFIFAEKRWIYESLFLVLISSIIFFQIY